MRVGCRFLRAFACLEYPQLPTVGTYRTVLIGVLLVNLLRKEACLMLYAFLFSPLVTRKSSDFRDFAKNDHGKIPHLCAYLKE